MTRDLYIPRNTDAGSPEPAPKMRGPMVATPSPRREYQYHVDSEGWTPDKVRCALQSAESGTLESLADLTETMFSDDRIDGVLSTRTLGLLGLPLHFKGGNALAVEALTDGEAWEYLHSESELAALHQWGIMLGIGLAQRIPIPRVYGEPQRYKLETWSPRWLYFDWNRDVWYVQTVEGREIVEGDKWILYTPYGELRPWARGKWRACVFPWLLKRFALEDRANYSETAGQPVRVGYSPQGSTEHQRRSFHSQLASLGRNSSVVLPEDWELKVAEATSTNWQIYTESVAWSDSAITIVLAGQLVTTEGGPGFSNSNVQDRIRVDLIRFDARALANCLYNQSLKPWARVNFGSEDFAPFPVWNVEKQSDLASLATTFETLGRAIVGLDEAFKSEGLAVDVRALANQYGIPTIRLAPDEKVVDVADLGLAPTDIARVITVNEARASKNLGPLMRPDGTYDPRGDAMVTDSNRGLIEKENGDNANDF